MRHFFLLMSAALAGCTTAALDPSRPGATSTAPSSADAAAALSPLAPILAAHKTLVLSESPTFATSVGVRDYDTLLPDPSLAAYAEGIAAREEILADLRRLNPRRLGEQDRLNRELLMLELGNEIDASRYGGKYMIMTNRSGPHLYLTGLPRRLPFRTEADYTSYVARLGQASGYLAAATARLRAGIDAEWVQPCESMAGYEDSINTHVVIDPADSVLMDPFDTAPAALDPVRFEALKQDASNLVLAEVIPALREFEAFYNLEYQPACREKDGTNSLLGGDAYYDHRVKLFTTTDMTADEVHQVGLSEVARIRAEMEEIAAGEGYTTLAAFQRYLRSNPDFYPKTAQERMEKASTIAKRMDGQMVNLFTKMPRMPYDIQEIPLDIAEKTTTAYYSQPAGDGSRAGTYWLNTTKLETRPLYELEALTLHEAVPGHHFQIALAQEMDLPFFRSFGGFTAFVEGWGLYSERLGLEVGFYQTPYTNFGRLSYEMWRASRLVVDTGIHSKGWTRQQAIDFMVANTGLSLNNITTEVDRYITWPGQALAYKIGELKIRELRARAEAALGANFDVRLFHDELLRHGAVPLSVLEDLIDAWIASQLAA